MKRVIVTMLVIISWLYSFSVYAQQDAFARLGRGTIEDAAFSPDSKILAIATTKGIYFHNPADFTELAFIDLSGFSVGHDRNSICFSPDGKLLASSTINRTGAVALWNAMTYEKITEIKADGYTGTTYSIRFSPDGKLIAFGCQDGTIKILDVMEKKEIDELKGHNRIARSICFSPDSNLLASLSDDNTIKLWDMATHKVIETFSRPIGVFTGSSNNVAFSPDSNLLAIGGNGTIRIIDVKKLNEKGKIFSQGFSSPITFSPDGKTLASGGVKLWDVETLKETDAPVIDPVRGLMSIQFSPDGGFLLCIGYTKVMMWDVKAWKGIKTSDEYLFDVGTIAISSDGRLLACGDSGGGFAKLWDLKNHEVVSKFMTDSFINSVAFSPDNRLLAVGCFSDRVKVWNIRDNAEFAEFDTNLGWVEVVVFSLDSKLLAIGGFGGLELWDLQIMKAIPLNENPGYMHRAVFSPDGKLLVSGGENKIIYIWDIEKLKVIRKLNQPSVINSFAFSPDGKLLATGIGGNDSRVKLWNMDHFKEIAAFSGGIARPEVAFNNNGNLIAIGCWDRVELWNVPRQNKVASFQFYPTMSVCFSPDGQLLASSNSDSVTLWDMQSYDAGQSVESNGKFAILWGRIKSENLETPGIFVLGQNYPNPFNPQTWIPYQLREASYVSIDIYDANGHLVRNLCLGRREAGIYSDRTRSAYWDGRNNNGERVKNGVYFYILRVDSLQSKPRKMILLK